MDAAKACSLCKKARPLDDFHRDARSKDGRRSRCSSCISAISKEDSKKAPVIDEALTHMVCPRCERLGRESRLSLESFGVARRKKTGKNSWCRQCCSEATCEWQKTEEGRRKHIEAVKRYNERKRLERSRL